MRKRCPSIGSTLLELGLRGELRRAGRRLPLAAQLAAGDVLKLRLEAAQVAKMRKSFDGLEPAVFRDLELLPQRRRRRLYEAVLARGGLAERELEEQPRGAGGWV